jgi:hypothetical protein
VYDGTTYYFLNNRYKREISQYDYPKNKVYQQLVSVCEAITYDLKHKNFKEVKYFDLIDKILTTNE